jgi:hypothetical protein
MRWLAVVSIPVLTGCASAPPQSPHETAIAVHIPPALERPWLMPRPADEVTLLDTRTLQALRRRDDLPGLNAVERPGLWLGVGLGVAAGIFVIDTAECVGGLIFGDDDDC